MKSRRFVVLLFTLTLSLPTPADDRPALLPGMDEPIISRPLSLLPTGEDLWGNDLEARPTEGWMGLYWDDAGSWLHEAAAEFDSDGSDPERVVVDSRPPGAAFLFRDLPELQGGPLAEATVEGHSLQQTRVLRIRLGDKRYLLRLEGSDENFADAVITLSSGDREQVLFRADGWADEAHFSLLWAGDLDRDGELDLLVIFSPKYSMYPMDLLLSSGAAPGDLLRHAATFVDYSC